MQREITILTEIVIVEAKNIESYRAIEKGVFPKSLIFFRKKNN